MLSMSRLPNGTNIQIDNYTANWRVHEKTKQQHDVEFKGEILCRGTTWTGRQLITKANTPQGHEKIQTRDNRCPYLAE